MLFAEVEIEYHKCIYYGYKNNDLLLDIYKVINKYLLRL